MVTAVIPVKTCEFIQHCDIGPVINILTLGLDQDGVGSSCIMGLFAQFPVQPLGLVNEIIVLTIFSSTSVRLTYL